MAKGQENVRRSRNFCFTVNNYSDADLSLLQSVKSRYVCYGKETAPTSKTPHLQGFISFEHAKTFSRVKSLLPAGCHIEVARGSPAENREYCAKDGDFFENGELPVQGRRNDLECVAESCRRRTPLREIASEFPTQFIRYSRGISQLWQVFNEPDARDFKTSVFVLFGEPGCGKSFVCREFGLLFDSTYYKPRGDWWDGYENATTVIVDDFYGWIKYDELLKICDRYPYRVPIKGGYRVFASRYILITSNSSPESWYTFDSAPLMRRIDCILEFTSLGRYEIKKGDDDASLYPATPLRESLRRLPIILPSSSGLPLGCADETRTGAGIPRGSSGTLRL